METVYIESTKQVAAMDLRLLLGRRWQIEDSAGEGIVVHGVGRRVYIVNEDDADPPSRHVLLLNYSDEDLVKEVLKIIADDSEVMVDNDFGVVLPGDQFVARLTAEPNWHWRR